MNTSIESRLRRLAQAGQQHLLKGGLKGLEKESLRITPQGTIATTPHPEALGSALTHPYITTDYSEALIELITPPFQDPAETLGFLEDLHRYVYQHLGDELLLATSMPCEIEGDASIPIATYGSSNIGRMKHVYRRGLAWRYGRAMQAIAGIHFNYSVNEALWPVLQGLERDRQPLQAYIADQYFRLIRNVHRHGWLILYLFGSSPALCRSFFAGREDMTARFEALDARTLFRPHATSLRMSDIGYRNDSQAGLEICFNRLDDYVSSLCRAISTPYDAYERIGVKVAGDYRQLNTNILQIENEYYSPIRPKQIAQSCEKPTLALKRRGIRYVELRSVDLGCAHPVGIDLEGLRFLEVFMLYCLLEESPPFQGHDRKTYAGNSLTVACCGRTPGFSLWRGHGQVLLRDWALEIADGMAAIAEALDQGDPAQAYTSSLARLEHAIHDPQATPSAKVLDELRQGRESFGEYGVRISSEHARTLKSRALSPERAEEFARQSAQSLQEQAQIEASDNLSFDEFLRRYFEQACQPLPAESRAVG